MQNALGWALPRISEHSSLETVAFELVEWAEAQGRLDELWQAFQVAKVSSNSCPFAYGSAIAPEGFYGRSSLIRDIRNRIGGAVPQCVNLVGMRRAGKSLLLWLIVETPFREIAPVLPLL